MGEKRKLRIKCFITLFITLCILFYTVVPHIFPSDIKVIRDARLFDEPDIIPIDESDDLQWLATDSFNASTYIHLEDLSMIHEPRIRKDFTLRDPHGELSPKTKVLIFCHSAPDNFVQRDAIRETWGSKLDIYPITLIFLIGKTRNVQVQKEINMEASLHSDILQEDFLDSYHILSVKSVFMLKYLKYLVDSQVNIQFVLKIDDDCYLNPKALFKFTPIAKTHPYTIFGKALGPESPVHRPGKDVDDNKWTVPKYVYKEDVFPNAASGSGYFFDVEAGLCLFRQALEVPIINLEDIYLTGLLRSACRINIRNNSKFHFMGRKICEIRKSDILIHHVKSPRHMYMIHEVLSGIANCYGRKTRRTQEGSAE